MKGKNIVFIAKSLDGFIAGKNNELDWLSMLPNSLEFRHLKTEVFLNELVQSQYSRK
jgi:hypothetical protein